MAQSDKHIEIKDPETEEIIESGDYHQYSRYGSSYYKEFYENKSAHSMKVTGIIRAKYDSPNPLYSTILLYHPSLLSNVVNPINLQSDICKDQLEYKTKFDVINGAPFADIESGGYHFTAEYQYESRLIDIGARGRTTAIYYYTDTFEQRLDISKYINSYNGPNEVVLRTKDYLEQVTSSFSSITKTFSTVLFVFSLVSILVSVILTAILTYISVLERKREIGLLRSLGARKRDISIMFISEAGILGIVSGILGIALCYILAPVLAKIVVNLIGMANSNILKPSVETFSHIQPWLIPVLFVAAIAIGILASFIPALIAGHKKPADSLRE